MQRFLTILSLVVASVVAHPLGFATRAIASSTAVTFNLTSPTAESNTFDITVTVGEADPVSDVSEISGTIAAMLQLDVSGGNVSVTELTLAGGTLDFTNVSFLIEGFLLIDSSDLGATVVTANPPTGVANGEFDGTAQRLNVNRGIFNIPPGLGTEPTVDISDLGFGGPGNGQGALSLTQESINGNIATYEATLSLPFDFADTAQVIGEDLDVLFEVVGQIGATAQFTVDLASSAADADSDGDVDGRDFLCLQRRDASALPQWESEFGPGSTAARAIPEPHGTVLIAAMLLATTAHRRSRLDLGA